MGHPVDDRCNELSSLWMMRLCSSHRPLRPWSFKEGPRDINAVWPDRDCRYKLVFPLCEMGTHYTHAPQSFLDSGQGPKNIEVCRIAVGRHEILRGFFHRENRILLRKSQILDLDTILYSMCYVKKKFKKPDLLVLWKNPLAFPCLLILHKHLSRISPGDSIWTQIRRGECKLRQSQDFTQRSTS